MNESLHTTVLLDEAVSALRIRENGTYVDCTFGRGGHSRLILNTLGGKGRLIAIDRDVAAIDASDINDSRFTLHHASMSEISQVLDDSGVEKVDGVLADLGVSSPQLDDGQRGFSFRFDAPLDMRMDQTQGETVADWLARADEQEIGEVIWRYGEERFAKAIARKIVAARGPGRLRTTGELAKLVGETVRTREPGFNPATRTFQALRIYINQELEEVETMLPQAVSRLAVGGRLVVISFHSLEDRIVKRFMQSASRKDSLPSDFPIRANEINEATLLPVGRAVKASDAEVAINPRARSAVMRTAERTGVSQ
ncbi:MAG: 16S rRNA (cytosine(1402)-N(4))-methyltransferase RsmH [Rhodocyclaceae bacterium]|nr:16S rRNA (cytosine(1402)-N(4))-methyltransferase RsmH [Rhodocyclaceae bacterium]MCA3022179.1 16S rRNA (cytosine(1402)-N(4))-methyltransferase RsmH [Rhodocyclaceae bacterium]MCA3024121.1 16S rRNA (cytosine(1402)-N(4))-methyltransferase RsmH [Rhodocyclaceae bacterium]MCA3029804.1 16S rRNA (cytosine(1402)-N(4))-methyltransferase RsmH [Rhodocyclaceae bacterium]MCA3030861.1 16S rRNA (cytosine(1402)-N(4))-methyltransferase RsmH [Rhodocyclaceae bacterium]